MSQRREVSANYFNTTLSQSYINVRVIKKLNSCQEHPPSLTSTRKISWEISKVRRFSIEFMFPYWSILIVPNNTFNICNTKNVLCGNFLFKNLSQDCFSTWYLLQARFDIKPLNNQVFRTSRAKYTGVQSCKFNGIAESFLGWSNRR